MLAEWCSVILGALEHDLDTGQTKEIYTIRLQAAYAAPFLLNHHK
jgi:hypothetical protein